MKGGGAWRMPPPASNAKYLTYGGSKPGNPAGTKLLAPLLECPIPLRPRTSRRLMSRGAARGLPLDLCAPDPGPPGVRHSAFGARRVGTPHRRSRSPTPHAPRHFSGSAKFLHHGAPCARELPRLPRRLPSKRLWLAPLLFRPERRPVASEVPSLRLSPIRGPLSAR